MIARTLRAELRKCLRLKWSWISIVGMNSFSAVILLLTLLVWFRSSALDDAARMSVQSARQVSGILSFVFLTQSWIFSVLGVLFLGLLVGELVAREAAEGSVSLLLLAPNSRVSVLFSKALTILAVYFVALLVGLCLQGSTILLLSRVHPIFLEVVDGGVLLRIVAAHVLIDLSWMSLLFFFSTLTSGGGGTVAAVGAFWLVNLTVDAAIFLGTNLGFAGSWTAALGRYTFTATCRVLDTGSLQRYLFTGGDFPLSTTLLGVNGLYTIAFFALALIVFRHRDI